MWMITLYNTGYNRYETIISQEPPFETVMLLHKKSDMYIDNDTIEYSKDSMLHIVNSYKLTEKEIELFNKIVEENT